ncbi:G-D-S-L family lipolytic protein [Calidifontibacter sp. DB0510]|uniref:G-D-S-L family lipolytic protein n=1 Tax=Metallococcus carri TaxID=1656884 RepID=A0A967B1Q4_9MICO|nr:GDSL-type esterase/lipase family protein [Metallococcus carri]NHN56407.1 G-D-S-L family lipolytic protein [Metallococcus carri]NOP36031.1 G-D-S-L family lipolytic protein [Calidifontibacter sp. DB2511S]
MDGSRTGAEPEFNPSADFRVAEGPRQVGVCFVGDDFVAGLGDPKALGWVSRVVARTPHAGVDVATYNLGIRGDSSTEILGRWQAETAPRWAHSNERRLVLSSGLADIEQGLSTARSRLNLANVLDDASSAAIATFVVGPPPTLDNDTNERLQVLVDAQADVCSRRGVTYVDCFRPLLGHDQWQTDLAAGDGRHPGQAGYGLIAWLVLHAGWQHWLRLDA